jgi:hypothetical protein
VEIPTNDFAHLERPDLVCDASLGVVKKFPVETNA